MFWLTMLRLVLFLVVEKSFVGSGELLSLKLLKVLLLMVIIMMVITAISDEYVDTGMVGAMSILVVRLEMLLLVVLLLIMMLLVRLWLVVVVVLLMILLVVVVLLLILVGNVRNYVAMRLVGMILQAKFETCLENTKYTNTEFLYIISFQLFYQLRRIFVCGKKIGAYTSLF